MREWTPSLRSLDRPVAPRPDLVSSVRQTAYAEHGRRVAAAWYAAPMITTIDKAGRVVIPVDVRKRLGLNAGTKLEMVIEGFAIRLGRAVAGPDLGRRGERLVARPRAAEGERTEVDVARLIEEERDRWPG